MIVFYKEIAMESKQVIPRYYLLQEVAMEQWHADAPGGATALRQLEVTKRKLALIGLTPESQEYREAYQRIQDSFR